MREKIWSCALTGHRELPAEFDVNALYDKLEELLKKGCDAFFCGMAQGFDLAALECLVALKEKYRFTAEACIPYRGFERGFALQERRKFERYLPLCDRKTVLFEKYCAGCFMARDRYMVDSSDVVLAYCKRSTGGTAYTANYAVKKGKPVIFLR